VIRIVLSSISVAVLAYGAMALQGDARPALPDFVSPKAFPNGCVSCHSKGPTGDHRLSVSLAKVKGHTAATKSVKKVPEDCAKCHKPGAKITSMSEMAHKGHYGKGEQSMFNGMFAGQCHHCHRMDAKTGKVAIKSGPKNW
jgi:hypothetical protein